MTAGASAAALAADQYNQEGLQSRWDGIYAVVSADYQSGCDLLPSLYEQVNDSYSLPVTPAYVDATQDSIYSLVDAMHGVEPDLVGTSCLAQSEPTVIGEQAPVAVAAGATTVSPGEQRLSSAKVRDGAAASAALYEALTAASKSHTVLAAQVTQAQWHEAKAGYASAAQALNKSVESGKALTEKSVSDVALRKALQSHLDEAGVLLEAERPEATSDIDAATADLKETKTHLDDAATKVEESHQAWQAEQERIAAEKARAAATPSQSTSSGVHFANTGSSSSPSAGSSAASSGSNYTLYASNCADTWNAQSCVDGSSISYIDFSPWGGPQWVGGHNTGASGVIANFQAGDIVTVSGSSAAGTYRISGSSWIPKVSGQSASSLGGGFAFQTCVGNQMRLVWASRI